MSMLQTFTPMQWVAPNCLGLRVISQLLFNCLNNLFILWSLPHPCSSSSCRPSWGWRCCTVCRTTAGRGSRPGCTAWACVPSSSSPPCFISSPGRRVTWGEDWSINKHSGRRFMPEILVGGCVFVLVLFQCFQSGAFSLHRLFYFWKLPTFSVPFLWLPVLIICFVHPFKKKIIIWCYFKWCKADGPLWPTSNLCLRSSHGISSITLSDCSNKSFHTYDQSPDIVSFFGKDTFGQSFVFLLLNN